MSESAHVFPSIAIHRHVEHCDTCNFSMLTYYTAVLQLTTIEKLFEQPS